ncbi:tetratricopeptide (TPR) repeat protein [Streptomyces sp. PvR006]|uniref:hypothetical protein n=1 Tax=Streptomyces sp. PvR006 TaxID=2817860 RepID=UPI001AE75FDC|nr:hypothetical protein [Streptomyces sp. PvR006]MBP2585413.1 tetratricopeptide (TPR) repeat protein [Streptomyces sp. PvR006]
MVVDEAGEPGRGVSADALLHVAEQAFLRADFKVVRPLLQQLDNDFGPPDTESASERYDVLLGALAARAGNWREVVRRCPDVLDQAVTGIVHSLAVHALRELAQEGQHTADGLAAVVIVLWAYLLDEDDPGDFRALLTERRGSPVADDLWESALVRLRGRVVDLLHAQDVRAGRDILSSWQTAWEAECSVGAVFIADVPTDAGPHALVSLHEVAWYLVRDGRGAGLLAAYAARHPEEEGWPADSPGHDALAKPLAQALADQGQERARAGEWSEALADLDEAVWLGHTLRTGDEAAVLRAGQNVGRSRTGRENSLPARIAGLERAHTLLPQNASLTAELTAELVRQGWKVRRSDAPQSRDHFTRALALTPKDPDAQAGLDDHLRADLDKALGGTHAGDTLAADEVRDLLERVPDCAQARRWLGRHYEGQAVDAAARGRTEEARSAVREMLRSFDPAGPKDEVRVDSSLVGHLVVAARHTESGTRAGLELRVDLLHAAAALPSDATSRIREDLDEAILHLAEHLEATASPTDVIGLFLQDRIRTGVSARFDQIVKAAYLNRARARESAGDPGGARRDRTFAERVGAGLSPQTPLFGSDPGRPRPADPGQDTLF